MKNRKLFFVLTILVFLLFIFSFFIKKENIPEETYNLYQNSKYKYEVLYPSNGFPFAPILEDRNQIAKNKLSINDIQTVQFRDQTESNNLFTISVTENKKGLSPLNFLVGNCKLTREEECLNGDFSNLKTNSGLDYLMNSIKTNENTITRVYYLKKLDKIITIAFPGIKNNDQDGLKIQERVVNSLK